MKRDQTSTSRSGIDSALEHARSHLDSLDVQLVLDAKLFENDRASRGYE